MPNSVSNRFQEERSPSSKRQPLLLISPQRGGLVPGLLSRVPALSRYEAPHSPISAAPSPPIPTLPSAPTRLLVFWRWRVSGTKRSPTYSSPRKTRLVGICAKDWRPTPISNCCTAIPVSELCEPPWANRPSHHKSVAKKLGGIALPPAGQANGNDDHSMPALPSEKRPSLTNCALRRIGGNPEVKQTIVGNTPDRW